MSKVLFVCHGNINRSPAGEVILNSMNTVHECLSVGLRPSKNKITKSMRLALEEYGYTVPTDRRMVPITEDHVKWADIIFYMDSGNEKRLLAQFPNYVDKFTLLSQYINEKRIQDPHFFKGIEKHKEVVVNIRKALEEWIKQTNEVI